MPRPETSPVATFARAFPLRFTYAISKSDTRLFECVPQNVPLSLSIIVQLSAVLATCAQFHADYLALKETVLHELAHWASHLRHGPWQSLGPSEMSTEGHGDYWQQEVRRIQVSSIVKTIYFVL
jgi:hypothetical protein